MLAFRESVRDQGRLLQLIAFASGEGWTISLAAGRRLTLSKPGLPSIFMGINPYQRDDDPKVPPRRRPQTRPDGHGPQREGTLHG